MLDASEVWRAAVAGKSGRIRLEDHFRIKVVVFPAYDFAYDEFKEKIETLRGLIDRYPIPAYRVHVDDIPDYMQQIFTLIESEQHLNLPDQELLLAEHKCKEAQNEVIKRFTRTPQWMEASRSAIDGVVEEFGVICSELYKEALSGFDDSISYYSMKITEPHRVVLVEELDRKVLRCIER